MANYRINFRRGLKADLPILTGGEPAITIDTKEAFAGLGNGDNISFVTENNYVKGTGADNVKKVDHATYADSAGSYSGNLDTTKLTAGTLPAGVTVPAASVSGKVASASRAGSADFATHSIGLSGEIKMFGGNTPPNGTLLCDGAAVSRTIYADLFAAIGVTWGSGDGINTFNLPDLRNFFTRGASSSRAVGSSQTDAFQGHRMLGTSQFLVAATGANNANFRSGGDGMPVINGSDATYDPVTDGTNGTPRTASETRPINKAVLYVIVV